MRSPNPRTVHNLLSEGAGEADLYLTFSFEFHKDCEPGSVEEGEMWKVFRQGAGRSVEAVVRSIREHKAKEVGEAGA